MTEEIPDWALLLVGGAVAWWWWSRHERQHPAPPPQQIAVPTTPAVLPGARLLFGTPGQPCPPGTWQQFLRDGSGRYNCAPDRPGPDPIAEGWLSNKKGDLPS